MRQVAGFDPDMKDRLAECDGGGAIAGTRYAGRQEFTGRLTGEYVDHGDPPWRWYLMVDLTRKPDNYTDNAVWCESGNVWLLDETQPLGFQPGFGDARTAFPARASGFQPDSGRRGGARQ